MDYICNECQAKIDCRKFFCPHCGSFQGGSFQPKVILGSAKDGSKFTPGTVSEVHLRDIQKRKRKTEG